MIENFDVPIVLFFFKRVDKTIQIIERIAKVKPLKIYLISDGPRNEEEAKLVSECRYRVESLITWPCEIIKNYAEINKGVYDRIAKGAKWVFSFEASAIFLEDDNLPELSFFQFCRDMLSLYKEDSRVLWICGTNYLKEFEPTDGSSYVFTQHMLPCGWASWSQKFTKFYDGELTLWGDKDIKRKIKSTYKDKKLLKQDMYSWDMELRRISKSIAPISWDIQMSFTIRVHGMYGIVPKFNQIRNIGVDLFSIHGGNSMSHAMTKRFCELETKQMQFPLIHPKVMLCDPDFELRTGKIILYPFSKRILIECASFIKKIFMINPDYSFTRTFNNIFSKIS